jgi:hypothetical protein
MQSDGNYMLIDQVDDDAAPGESDIDNTDTMCSFFFCSTYSPLDHTFDCFSIEQLLESELLSKPASSFMHRWRSTSNTAPLAVNTDSNTTSSNIAMMNNCPEWKVDSESVPASGGRSIESPTITNSGLSSLTNPNLTLPNRNQNENSSCKDKLPNGPLHNQTD